MRHIILLTVMGAAAGLWAGENVWTSLGPDGGAVSALVIDPLNPDTVYAATNVGLFRSTDGGANWGVTPLLDSGVVGSLVIDPHNPSILYATSISNGPGGPREVVLKSADGGSSWRPLTSLSAFGPAPLAMDPDDPNTLYLGVYNEILKSTDGGETWKTSFSGPPGSICCLITRSLVIDPRDSSTVYAVTGSAIFKSTNRGASWSAVYPYSGRREDPQFASLVIDPQDSNTLYAPRHAYGGVYKSTDGGASWSAANKGLPGGDPVNLLRVSSLAVHRQRGGTLYLATGLGIFKSTDGAANWTKLDSQPGEGNVGPLAIDPQNDGILYVSAIDSTGGGVYKSKDGGASWSAANSGLRALEVRRLAIVPQQPDTLYAGGSAMGILKSTDKGTGWNHVSNLALLAVDPQDPAVLFGIGPRGLEKSTDGGVNWSPAKAGLRGGDCSWVGSLTIDPKDTRTVYAGLGACPEGSRNGGVWKSTDGGAGWTKLDSQPDGGDVYGLAIDQNTSALYAWGEMGLFMSTDRGGSWTKLRSGYVNGFTIDPQTSGTLYVVVDDEANSDCCGVFKSFDGGESWSAVNAGLPATHVNFSHVDGITALVIDPSNTATLYAATRENGVYQTKDGGASWNALNSGLTTRYIHALAMNPRDTNTLYAGTAGGVFAITFAAQ